MIEKIKDKAKSAKELYKDYKAEVVEYDPEIDGSKEHMVRELMLDEKERMKDVLSKLKSKIRGNDKERR